MKIFCNNVLILSCDFVSQEYAVARVYEFGMATDGDTITRVAETPDEQRDLIREAIADVAGDQQSLLGTTSDAIGLLFFEVAKLAIALKDQNSLAAIRDAATPLADMMAPVIARVEAGDTLLTHLVKGEANVIEEMEQRATQVATVLQSAQSA